MPEEGVELSPNDKILTKEEIIRLSTLFVNAGVDKIRLTGGEPTVNFYLNLIINNIQVRKEVEEISQGIGQIPGLKILAMTTNGKFH